MMKITEIASSKPFLRLNKELARWEIWQNDELIKALEPFVANKLLAAFKGDTRDRIIRDRSGEAKQQAERIWYPIYKEWQQQSESQVPLSALEQSYVKLVRELNTAEGSEIDRISNKIKQLTPSVRDTVIMGTHPQAKR